MSTLPLSTNARGSQEAALDVAEVDAEDLLARAEIADHVEDLFARLLELLRDGALAEIQAVVRALLDRHELLEAVGRAEQYVLVEALQKHIHVLLIPQLKLGDTLLKSSELTPELLASMDAVVIATDHSGIPLTLLADHAPFIYDTRNVTRYLDTNGRRVKIIRLGSGAEPNESM